MADEFKEPSSASDEELDERQSEGLEVDDDDESKDGDFAVGERLAATLTRDELERLKPWEQLGKWNGICLPVEVDIITELDATNIFFVSGESMIVDLLLSKEVKFDEDTQFLRMTFAIERILSDIRACGGNFRVIFFDGMK